MSGGKPILKGRLITTLLIVAIIALLAVYFFLGTDYLRQRQGHKALTAQINEANSTLAQTPKPPQDLEERLDAAEASLDTAQNTFPKDLNSTQIINAILKLADDCQVRAIPLVTQPWSMENIGEGYHVFHLTVTARGGYSQLIRFVSQLENGELETLVVQNLNVMRIAGPTEGETIPFTASLYLAIYTQLTPSE